MTDRLTPEREAEIRQTIQLAVSRHPCNGEDWMVWYAAREQAADMADDLLRELDAVRRERDEKQKTIEYLCLDSTQDDTAIRAIARKHLSEIECEGDSYGVTPLVDVVEQLETKLVAERDAYRAVLEGAEFREIPKLATKGTEFCKMVGIELAKEIKRRIQFTGWTST